MRIFGVIHFIKLSTSFFIVFHILTVVSVSFCSIIKGIKGITPNIRMLCFVPITSVLLSLLCVWIFYNT